jgi:hypothetical protein
MSDAAPTLRVNNLNEGGSSDGPLVYDPSRHEVWLGGPFADHADIVQHMKNTAEPVQWSQFKHPEYEYGQKRGTQVNWYTPYFDAEDEVNDHLGVEPVDYDEWDFNS